MKNERTDGITIPEDILLRTPLFRPEWMPMYNRLREHPHAPKWNAVCGDRIESGDALFIQEFRRKLYRERIQRTNRPPEFILEWIHAVREDVRVLQKNIGDAEPKDDFEKIVPMNREDIALRIADVIPQSLSLERLIVNDTSGTTGHPVKVPNHPRAIGCYDPMVLFMLERHRLRPEFNHETVACFLVCAQEQTMTYCAVHSGLNGAGYAKINLKQNEWPHPQSPSEYIMELNPWFITGDPLSFHELMKLDIPYKPNALLSTAVGLTPELRRKYENYFQCPLIDMYSLNDTGPIGYSCPNNPLHFHVLPTDIHVEIIDTGGETLPEGESGEIAVTGGRNPFVPLLRYRTGDYGRMRFDVCECGDPMPRIYDFHGRSPVYFRNDQNATVNPVDISKILRRFPLIQFQFQQFSDLSCRLRLRGDEHGNYFFYEDIRESLGRLFGSGVDILIEETPDLGSGKKVIPFISDFTLSSDAP